MAFDLFQSRRNCNEPCRWWARNEDEEMESDELIYSRIPAGYFYAKEVDAETTNNSIIGGTFMLNRTTVTIMSPDNLESIAKEKRMRSEVIVEYQGELWRVDNVQKRKARIQNSEFVRADSVSHYWYLSLIK